MFPLMSFSSDLNDLFKVSFFLKMNACYDFGSCIFNTDGGEHEQYVARLVKSHQLSHSQLSEIGQQEQFLHFDKSLQNVLAERPTVNPVAQRSLQALLVGLKNDVISLSFLLSRAPSILSKGPVPLASLWIKSP